MSKIVKIAAAAALIAASASASAWWGNPWNNGWGNNNDMFGNGDGSGDLGGCRASVCRDRIERPAGNRLSQGRSRFLSIGLLDRLGLRDRFPASLASVSSHRFLDGMGRNLGGIVGAMAEQRSDPPAPGCPGRPEAPVGVLLSSVRRVVVQPGHGTVE